jgi:hypothetical protein
LFVVWVQNVQKELLPGRACAPKILPRPEQSNRSEILPSDKIRGSVVCDAAARLRRTTLRG